MQNLSRYFQQNKFFNIIIIITISLSNAYYYYDISFWFDEWATFLVADPNIKLDSFFSRLKGNSDNNFIPENVPYLYYLILRIYFDFVGYNPENGRFFSLFFYLFSSILLYLILSQHNSNKVSLVITLLFCINPYFLYVGMEMRVGIFFTFLTLTTSYVFLKIFEKRNIKLYFILLLLNIFSLTTYPILICVIVCQILYVAIYYFSQKKIDYYLLICLLLSIIIYLLINYNYLIDKVDTSSSHWARLNIYFFYGLFFNIYFNSILLGFIILIFFYFIVFFKKNLWINNFLLLYSIIIIFVSYLFVIISSTFFVPISSPKYIVFVLPFLYTFLCINFYNLFKKYNSYILKFSIILFVIINIITTENKWLKKPDTNVAIDMINSMQIKNIYVDPHSLHFNFFYNHLKNLKYLNKFNVNVFDRNFQNTEFFAHLCLNNPRYDVENQSKLEDNKICNKEFNNFNKTKSERTKDYLITFFKKIST